MVMHQSQEIANYLGLKVSKRNSSTSSATSYSIISSKRSHSHLPTSLLPTSDLTHESLIDSAPVQKKPRAVSTQSQLLVFKPGKEGHAAMHMAIADYFHSNAVPYRHVECPNFCNMLQVVKSVGKDYKAPTR